MPDDIHEIHPDRNRAVREHRDRRWQRDKRLFTGMLVALGIMVIVGGYGVFVYAPNKQIAAAGCINPDAVKESVFSRRHLVPWPTPAGTVCERLTDEQLAKLKTDPMKLTAHLQALGVIRPDQQAASMYPGQ